MQEVGRGGGAKRTNPFYWWCGQKSLHAPSVGRSHWQGYPDSEKSSDGRALGAALLAGETNNIPSHTMGDY